MNNLAIIDGDSIAYLCSKDDIQTTLSNVDQLLLDIFSKTSSTQYYLFLSKGPYFRHRVNPEYKNKRKDSPLIYLKTVKAYLKEQYGAIEFNGLEADDLVGYAMTHKLSTDCPKISCAIDKDVIKQIPGTHYNYRTGETITTNASEAICFLYKQVLMGDSTDNITGIPGVGEVGANKTIGDLTTIEELRKITMYEYSKKFPNLGDAEYQYQKTFRQVYLLRTPQDFINEVVYVPELPQPNSIY